MCPLVLKTWAVSLHANPTYPFQTDTTPVSEAYMVGDVDVSDLKVVMDVGTFCATVQFSALISYSFGSTMSPEWMVYHHPSAA